MKVLVRNLQTGLYFSGAEEWAQQPEKGVDFRHLDRAVDTACASRWRDVEVILWFDSSHGHRELHFPIV